MTSAVIERMAWTPGVGRDRLVLGAVDVWHADLDRIAEGDATLSEAERARSARFRFEADRRRWVRCRATLRLLLGSYLGCEPGDVRLEAGPRGKPAVAGGGIEFNLSHSWGRAVFAFAIDNPVGVDIEHEGRVLDPLAAARMLGDGEWKRLAALPRQRLDAAFVRAWVRHEAGVKCRGERIGTALEPGAVELTDLDVGPGAAAALALTRVADQLRFRELRS